MALQSIEINVSEYPYGSAAIIYSNNCAGASPLSVSDPDIIAGKLYRWNMYGYTDPLCGSCKSTVSSTLYFHIRQQFLLPDRQPFVRVIQ
jgi:hypothetical protein